jgi:dihydroneopterin aldolase
MGRGYRLSHLTRPGRKTFVAAKRHRPHSGPEHRSIHRHRTRRTGKTGEEGLFASTKTWRRWHEKRDHVRRLTGDLRGSHDSHHPEGSGMKRHSSAVIELRDLELKTDIGTYGATDTRPDLHLLDLTLGIGVQQTLIPHDGMAHVFDYDPLIAEIAHLAADGHYETQERLVTRIASACAAHPAILRIEICLRKSPVRSGSGSLGVRLTLDEIATDALRTGQPVPA